MKGRGQKTAAQETGIQETGMQKTAVQETEAQKKDEKDIGDPNPAYETLLSSEQEAACLLRPA